MRATQIVALRAFKRLRNEYWCLGKVDEFTLRTGEKVKILHTSDWHIGIKLATYDYLPDQRVFADWLLQTVRSEKIDVVLIAGDIFDRAIPSGESIDLVDEIFSKLIANDIFVVVISGNHDSAERLNFCSKAMEAAGLYIRTEQRDAKDIGDPIEISKNGESVFIIPVPYLDPQRVIEIDDAERSHGGLVDAILKSRMQQVPDPAKTIVMSHAFVAGGTESDSERKVSIGGTSRVAVDVYKDFGYVALGHLHRPQQVAGQNIFYSGTPLQYSFSEEHQKSVRIIEVGQTIESRTIDIPIGPTVVTLTDSIENLLKKSEYKVHEEHLVRVKLTDSGYQLNVFDRVSTRFPNLLDLSYVALDAGTEFGGSTSELTHLSPDEIVQQYIHAVHVDSVTPEIGQFIQESVHRVTVGGKQ